MESRLTKIPKRNRKTSPKKKNHKKIIISIIFILCLFISGFLFYLKTKVDKVTETKVKYKTELRKEKTVEATDPIGVLLIGTDAGGKRGAEEGERSDTLIYATVNPVTKTTNLYSISRDIFTWVDDNSYQKINAAYSLGKELQAAKAVEKLLDAPVDYYVSVNMDALSQIVDTLGGVEVDNQLGFPISIEDTEPDYKAIVPEGKQTINGEQALVYSRMRLQDPEGDIGRQKRQQEVIKSLVKKIKNPTSILKLNELLNIIGNNIRTNANTFKIIDLFKSYLGALETINSTSIIGRGEMIQNSYYMIVGKNNIFDIQNKIKEELNLPIKEEVSWENDINMLFVDDLIYPLDAGTHYDFPDFINIFYNPKVEETTEPKKEEVAPKLKEEVQEISNNKDKEEVTTKKGEVVISEKEEETNKELEYLEKEEETITEERELKDV